MYDFKREGFPGFPLGQKIEFYERKLPESRMVVTDLPGTDRSIRTLHSRLALEGSEHSSIACQLGEGDLVSLIEISWADGDKFSFEGLPLAGLSAEELVAQLRERGIAAEVGSVTWREAFRRAEPLVASVLPDPLLDPNEAAQRSRRTAQEWTSEVTNIVRGQAESSRLTGRLLAGGINVVTVSLMVSVFAMTGGITGIEVGVAGASAALSQTILESYFGERTVRSLAQQARESLERLANSSVRDVVAPVVACLDRSDDTACVDSLDAALKRASEVLV